MEANKQNACLMTTTFDEENNRTMLTYIPMTLSYDLFETLLTLGKGCENKECISFELDLDEDADAFWNRMWTEMKGED